MARWYGSGERRGLERVNGGSVVSNGGMDVVGSCRTVFSDEARAESGRTSRQSRECEAAARLPIALRSLCSLYTNSCFHPHNIMSSLQSRKDEIAAKRTKLAELKRQRELRAKDVSSSRQSIGDDSEVCSDIHTVACTPTLTDRLASPSIASPKSPHAVESGH